MLRAQRWGRRSVLLGQQLAAASFTGKMKQAWHLRAKRCLHSVPGSMVGKDAEPRGRSCCCFRWPEAVGGHLLLRSNTATGSSDPSDAGIQGKGKLESLASRVPPPTAWKLPGAPSDSDPQGSHPLWAPSSQPGTDTALALLEPPVVSGQDPSDSATSRGLWGLREDSPGLEQLHDPPSMGRARVTAANGDPTQGPSFNPRPITGKVESE